MAVRSFSLSARAAASLLMAASRAMAAEARALAHQRKAEREVRYDDAPWTPFTPNEVLYIWGGDDDDEAPSPDDDDDFFGVAAPDADASDAPPRPAPPRPAPRPLARMKRLPIEILPLRSNCRSAEPSRAPPFSWETRAAPSAVVTERSDQFENSSRRRRRVELLSDGADGGRIAA